MPWVRFTAPFDFSPAAKGGWVTVAYKAGMVQLVTRECATKAKAAGAAVAAASPRREARNAGTRGG